MDDVSVENFKIDILQVIHFIVLAWQQVTIQKCFNKCNYENINGIQPENPASEILDNEDEQNDNWIQLGENASKYIISFSDYILIDEELVTCGILTIEEMTTEENDKDD